MKKTVLKQAAAQKRYKQAFEKKVRLGIEVQLGKPVYIDRFLERVQHPESGTTDLSEATAII